MLEYNSCTFREKNYVNEIFFSNSKFVDVSKQADRLYLLTKILLIGYYIYIKNMCGEYIYNQNS